MKKIIYASLISILVFIILNFFYSNLNDQVFNYPITFRFEIPYIRTWTSKPIALGFALIVSFCLGILFLAVLQTLPALFKSLATRSKEQRIRELERQLYDREPPEGH